MSQTTPSKDDLTPFSVPDHVTISNKSIYGDTPPLPSQETLAANNHDDTIQNLAQGTTNSTSPETVIPLLYIILPTLLLSSLITFLLYRYYPNFKNTPASLPSSQVQSQTSQVPKTAFIPDYGYYERSQYYNATELVTKRIPTAKRSIVWVTSEPGNDTVLTNLTAHKRNSGIPVFILTGKETQNERIRRANQYGFIIHKLSVELETPYSIMLIDNSIVLDVSRENWLWETKEPQYIQTTATWIESLLKTATVNQ